MMLLPTRWIPCAAAALLLTACSPRERVLGAPPAGEARPLAAVSEQSPGTEVTVRGKMVEKCPVAGCWFIVSDGTGRVKVDTKAAGFVVVDVPVGADVTVGGKVARDGQERIVDAAGIRY